MTLTNGEQKIFIWIDFTPETEVVLFHAVQVALILNKEICLLYHAAKGTRKKEDAESRLIKLTRPIAELLGSERVHFCLNDSPLTSILTVLAEEYDALLLVAHKKNSQELLKQLPHGVPLFICFGPKWHR